MYASNASPPNIDQQPQQPDAPPDMENAKLAVDKLETMKFDMSRVLYSEPITPQHTPSQQQQQGMGEPLRQTWNVSRGRGANDR